MSELLLLAQRGWSAESFVWLRLMKRVAICSVPFLFGNSLVAADFTGKIVRILLDSDTIEVLHNQHPERIRPSGIDCPKKGQAYGKKAKHAVSVLVYGKEVILGWSTKEAEALPCPCAGPKVWLGFPSKALLP